MTRLETVVENINETNKSIRETLIRLENKVDGHFTWTIGLLMTLFGGIFLTGVLKEILHFFK
jgi:hypothetical protein